MNSYDTIQNIFHDKVNIPQVPSWGVGPAVHEVSAPVPKAQVKTYVPSSENVWLVKPESELSFKKVKRERLIKMTNYSRGKTTTRNHLVRLPAQSSEIAAWATWEAAKPFRSWAFGPVPLNSTWESVEDGRSFTFWRADIPFYDLDKTVDELVKKDRIRIQSNVISDAYNGFDLLTNLAEFPETLELILSALKAARHPLEGIRDLISKYKKARKRGKTHREAHDDLGSQWMQYRYGIMPIVYSIMDAIELLDEHLEEFYTVRSGYSVDLTSSSRPLIKPPEYFFQTLTGSSKIYAVGKCRYGSPSLRLSDLITANPFLTAWELIPMSFVIDWFVNVGDVIFSHTSTYMDLAQDRKFCISEKRVYTLSTFYHRDPITPETLFKGGMPPEARPHFEKDSIRPSLTYQPPVIPAVDHVCWDVSEESYDRKLFNPTDVELKFHPSLSWKRMLDGYVLSFSQISKILKNLRK